MSPRAWLRLGLLTIVLGSVGVWIARRDTRTDETAAPTAEAVARAKVLVTYFTTDMRCKTCRILEDLSRRTVQEGFPDEIARGDVLFRVVNTDRAEHHAYVDHYAITNKIVIVSRQRDGQEVEWTPRQDIWLHYDEPAEFFAYVREPIATYLQRP
jgi:hypothetical protein